MFSTPLGTPARSASSAIASAENGVCLGRLDHEGATRGKRRARTLRVIIAMGKSHGVIAAHTPMARFSTTMRLSACVGGITSP